MIVEVGLPGIVLSLVLLASEVTALSSAPGAGLPRLEINGAAVPQTPPANIPVQQGPIGQQIQNPMSQAGVPQQPVGFPLGSRVGGSSSGFGGSPLGQPLGPPLGVPFGAPTGSQPLGGSFGGLQGAQSPLGGSLGAPPGQPVGSPLDGSPLGGPLGQSGDASFNGPLGAASPAQQLGGFSSGPQGNVQCNADFDCQPPLLCKMCPPCPGGLAPSGSCMLAAIPLLNCPICPGVGQPNLRQGAKQCSNNQDCKAPDVCRGCPICNPSQTFLGACLDPKAPLPGCKPCGGNSGIPVNALQPPFPVQGGQVQGIRECAVDDDCPLPLWCVGCPDCNGGPFRGKCQEQQQKLPCDCRSTAPSAPSQGSAGQYAPSQRSAGQNVPSQGSSGQNPPSQGSAGQNPPSQSSARQNTPSPGSAGQFDSGQGSESQNQSCAIHDDCPLPLWCVGCPDCNGGPFRGTCQEDQLDETSLGCPCSSFVAPVPVSEDQSGLMMQQIQPTIAAEPAQETAKPSQAHTPAP